MSCSCLVGVGLARPSFKIQSWDESWSCFRFFPYFQMFSIEFLVHTNSRTSVELWLWSQEEVQVLMYSSLEYHAQHYLKHSSHTQQCNFSQRSAFICSGAVVWTRLRLIFRFTTIASSSYSSSLTPSELLHDIMVLWYCSVVSHHMEYDTQQVRCFDYL